MPESGVLVNETDWMGDMVTIRCDRVMRPGKLDAVLFEKHFLHYNQYSSLETLTS